MPAAPLIHSRLASAYALRGETERAAAELAEARRLSSDDRFSSIARLKAITNFGPPKIRALIEATAFGALTIINRFQEYGVNVEQIVTCGGIAEKNPLVMQTYADVTGRPIRVARSAQAAPAPNAKPPTCAQ